MGYGYPVLVNRIKYYRESLGMTQTDLADRVGLTKASISKLENEKNGTIAFTAALLCKVLGVSFEELFCLL